MLFNSSGFFWRDQKTDHGSFCLRMCPFHSYSFLLWGFILQNWKCLMSSFLQPMVSHQDKSTLSTSVIPGMYLPVPSLCSEILPLSQEWYILRVPQTSSSSACYSPLSGWPQSVSISGRQPWLSPHLLLSPLVLQVAVCHLYLCSEEYCHHLSQPNVHSSTPRVLYKYNPKGKKKKSILHIYSDM